MGMHRHRGMGDEEGSGTVSRGQQCRATKGQKRGPRRNGIPAEGTAEAKAVGRSRSHGEVTLRQGAGEMARHIPTKEFGLSPKAIGS